MQQTVLRFIESKFFQISIISLIIINAILLGLETSQTVMQFAGSTLKLIDGIILKVFVLELLLRLYARRLRFFSNLWNVFDLIIVAIALVPASGAFAALRALRVLRVLRIISAIPSMRRVIEGLFTAIPGIASVVSIMALFFYVFAVIGTHLYGVDFPEWFGTMGRTAYTLFQVMTLESWSMGIVRPVMEQHPSAWAFFICYILVTTFTMLNLFIAILVNAMHSDAEDDAEESRADLKKQITQEIQAAEKRILKALKEK